MRESKSENVLGSVSDREYEREIKRRRERECLRERELEKKSV